MVSAASSEGGGHGFESSDDSFFGCWLFFEMYSVFFGDHVKEIRGSSSRGDLKFWGGRGSDLFKFEIFLNLVKTKKHELSPKTSQSWSPIEPFSKANQTELLVLKQSQGYSEAIRGEKFSAHAQIDALGLWKSWLFCSPKRNKTKTDVQLDRLASKPSRFFWYPSKTKAIQKRFVIKTWLPMLNLKFLDLWKTFHCCVEIFRCSARDHAKLLY